MRIGTKRRGTVLLHRLVLSANSYYHAQDSDPDRQCIPGSDQNHFVTLVAQAEAVQAGPHSEDYGARYEASYDEVRVASSPQSLFQDVTQQYRFKSSGKQDNAPEKRNQRLS